MGLGRRRPRMRCQLCAGSGGRPRHQCHRCGGMVCERHIEWESEAEAYSCTRCLRAAAKVK